MFSYTASLAYVMPLMGGLVADVLWGRFRTIVVFSLVYIAGSALLAITAMGDGSRTGALLSLLLVSIGTGGIKPCVSAFGADQLSMDGERKGVSADAQSLRSLYFSRFYVSINVGSVFSFVVTPFLRVQFGFAVAFGASTVVLALATLIFACGAPLYKRNPPAGGFYYKFFAHIWSVQNDSHRRRCCRRRRQRRSYDTLDSSAVSVIEIIGRSSSASPQSATELGVDDKAFKAYPAETDHDVADVIRSLRKVSAVLALMPCFWAVFDQQGSTWILQADRMRRDGVLPFGWDLPPEVLQVLNPVFVVILVPMLSTLFNRWSIWFPGRRPPPALQRMTAGMFIAALAFATSALVEREVSRRPRNTVPILWQVPQIFLITLAEVLVSVESLAYFYGEAPEQAKSFVSALSLACVSVGDVLCGLIYQILSPYMGSSALLALFSALMSANCVVLACLARGGPET